MFMSVYLTVTNSILKLSQNLAILKNLRILVAFMTVYIITMLLSPYFVLLILRLIKILEIPTSIRLTTTMNTSN